MITTTDIFVDDDGSVTVLSTKTDEKELSESTSAFGMQDQNDDVTLSKGNYRYGILALGTKTSKITLPIGTEITIEYGNPDDKLNHEPTFRCNTHTKKEAPEGWKILREPSSVLLKLARCISICNDGPASR